MIENPVTGERFRWHLTSADTGGRLARAEVWVRPGGGVSVEHFHPHATERFEVLSGRMCVECRGKERVLLGGERHEVPAGAAHRWRNAGEEELHLFIEVSTPSGFEDMVEDAFLAAQRGESGPDGRIKLLPGAVYARTHWEAIRVTSPPPWLQRVIIPPLVPVGRLVNRRRAVAAPAPSAT